MRAHGLRMPEHSCPKCVICDRCSIRYCIGDSPVCKDGHGSVHRYAPFQSFVFTSDAGERIEVNSVLKLREIEKRSGELHRQGLGRPFVFRHYSQDRSNADAPIFGHFPKDIEGFDLKRARTRAGRITGGVRQFDPREDS